MRTCLSMDTGKPLQERTRTRQHASRGSKCSASRGGPPPADPFHSLMGVDTDEKARAAVRRLTAKRGRRIASSFRPPPGASPFELRAQFLFQAVASFFEAAVDVDDPDESLDLMEQAVVLPFRRFAREHPEEKKETLPERRQGANTSGDKEAPAAQ